MAKYYKKWFWLFVLPLLACFCIFFIAPSGMGFYYSFAKFATLKKYTLVGWTNYSKIFTANSSFWKAFGQSCYFVVVTLVIINVSAYLLALLLTKGLKGTAFFRSLFFMPNLVGGIILGNIWQLILNSILLQFNETLLSSFNTGFWGVVLITCWQQIGYMMIIYVAAITGVPTDVLESAEVDGASKARTTFQIIIPMTMPSITICTFMTLTNGFKLYDQNLALLGSNSKVQLLALDIYNTMFSSGSNKGPGQAEAILFFFIVTFIGLAQLIATRSKEEQA